MSILVNTHRHADHTGGNATYRREFPQVQTVASSPMAEDLASHGEETLKGWIDWAKQLDVELPKALASGTSLGGRPLTPDLRSSYEGDLAAAREIVADASRMKVEGPTLTTDTPGLPAVGARLVLRRHAGGQPRPIVIAGFGRGHTRGDLVVWLPTERILAVGDLLVVPVPLVGADQSYVEDWVKTLDRLQELGAAVTVPGHGSVQRDFVAAERYRDFLASVARQTRAAMDRERNGGQGARGAGRRELSPADGRRRQARTSCSASGARDRAFRRCIASATSRSRRTEWACAPEP